MPTHDLAALPANSRVFVDTNIFDLHFKNKSISCTAFINRLAQGELIGYVNIQVLSDLMHKLMLVEAYIKEYIKKISANELRGWLKANRHLANTLTQYQEQFEYILSIIERKNLHIGRKLMVKTKEERATYGLMTGDSLHLGTMRRNTIKLTDIVTHDEDFTDIHGLEVWRPMDVIP
jgi:predicted nucleic acid-binding protein